MPAPVDPVERQAYLARLRREIADGTYETPEKLAAAVDAMLDRSAVRATPANGRPPKPR